MAVYMREMNKNNSGDNMACDDLVFLTFVFSLLFMLFLPFKHNVVRTCKS